MRPIDVVVCGSLTVTTALGADRQGRRLLRSEVALLIEAGLVTEKTVIVAPVHALQVVEEEIPETDHEFSVNTL